MFNLKQLCVDIPTGYLVGVTGLPVPVNPRWSLRCLPKEGRIHRKTGCWAREQFNRVVEIGQASISRMKRSNVATYTEVYTEIRAVLPVRRPQ